LGLCFVGTLDNTYALRKYIGHMDDLFGSLSADNVKRIRTQNSRRISVILGNPPYNANQLNENENNKNREYEETTKLQDITFDEVKPDKNNNWINQTNNDFDSLIPLATKESKAAKRQIDRKAIFKLFSLGVVTARDEWVYDDARPELVKKVSWLIDAYNADLKKLSAHRRSRDLAGMLDTSIKWTRAVKNDLRRGILYTFEPSKVIEALYRPFVKAYLYFDKRLNEMQYQLGSMFKNEPNPTIAFLCVSSSNPLAVMAVQQPFDYCLLKMGNGGTQAVSFWYYDHNGTRQDNVTDWALDLFRKQYPSGGVKKKRSITKEAIFDYVYGVLHDPMYRDKYGLNLRREFPRIPFYADFWEWADWGKTLFDIHLRYEMLKSTPLKRVDIVDEKARKAGLSPRPMLRADKEHGTIRLDTETTLTKIPPEAWDYKLGNRSALEWILDQYKEKAPKDLTVREQFNSYRFADYKESVIDLLKKVTTVSLETAQIIHAMKKTAR
jgi:predicted helicase